MTVGEVAGAIPGVIALLGGALSIGRLMQRVADLESAVKGEDGILKKLAGVGDKVGLLEIAAAKVGTKVDGLSTEVTRFGDKLDRILERRTFKSD